MEAEGKSEVVIEVREALDAGLKSALPPSVSRVEKKHPATATIFRVPSDYRYMDEFTYTPKYVTIGPYHHSASSDNWMHAIKMQALRDLLDRDRNGRPVAENLEMYADIAFRRLGDVRKQYAEEIRLTDSALVQMLVTDGCFIIEFLIKWYLNDPRLKTDAMKSALPALRTDLLLVENQIPFFILDEFFKAATLTDDDRVGLMELALAYLSGGRVGAQMAVECYRNSEYKSVTIQHLLHLYHLVCLEPDFAKRVNKRSTQKLMSSYSPLPFSAIVRCLEWPCIRAVFRALFWLLSKIWWMREAMWFPYLLLYFLAKKLGLIQNVPRRSARSLNLSDGVPNARYLLDTGFKFKKKEPLTSFSYVSRKGMTIEIPALSRDCTPLVLLRNLIIFEKLGRSQPDIACWGSSVTSFVKFIDCLIATEEDVAILKDYDIIDRRFGDDKTVARTWSRLCKDVSLNDDHYLNKMFSDVMDYYDQNIHRVRFYQWRTSSPWAAISITAAIIGVVLTIASTFYTIFPYYHSRS